MRALLGLALFAAAVHAQPQPKPEKGDSKTVVKVYDTAHLTGPTGKASGVANIDAVLKVILDMLPAGGAKPEFVERDGGKLEVRATAKVHDEIKDLLAALARLQDLAIDIKAEVYEFDAAGYAQFAKALPKSAAKAPVLFAAGDGGDEDKLPSLEAANKLLKAARLVQTSKGQFVNGGEATVSARRTLVMDNTREPAFVKDGFALVAVPVVSADRRFVRFKLTEQSTAVVGTRKRELGEIRGQKVVAETPLLEDLGGTGSAVVPDGSSLLFKLAYAPKDKVWVVKLDTTIFIQAEENELKRQEEKNKK